MRYIQEIFALWLCGMYSTVRIRDRLFFFRKWGRFSSAFSSLRLCLLLSGVLLGDPSLSAWILVLDAPPEAGPVCRGPLGASAPALGRARRGGRRPALAALSS